jgi:hypothetical protein
MYSIGTTQGGNDILHNFISGETEEITLNADTTWYISSAVGGGYD